MSTASIGIEPAIKRAAAEELYIPNEETSRAIREAKAGIGLTSYDSVEDMKRAIGWD